MRDVFGIPLMTDYDDLTTLDDFVYDLCLLFGYTPIFCYEL